MFSLPEPVPHDELDAVLAAALRASMGSREASCFMASVAAAHLVNRMALAGIRVVRVPEDAGLTE